MPGGDRTGPMGMGMRSGRGAGCCSGEGRSGYAGARFGFRCGQGYGRGRGFRGAGQVRGFAAWMNRPWERAWPRDRRYGIDTVPYESPNTKMKKRMLTRQAEDLQVELDAVRKRLGDIDSAPKV